MGGRLGWGGPMSAAERVFVLSGEKPLNTGHFPPEKRACVGRNRWCLKVLKLQKKKSIFFLYLREYLG